MTVRMIGTRFVQAAEWIGHNDLDCES